MEILYRNFHRTKIEKKFQPLNKEVEKCKWLKWKVTNSYINLNFELPQLEYPIVSKPYLKKQ